MENFGLSHVLTHWRMILGSIYVIICEVPKSGRNGWRIVSTVVVAKCHSNVLCLSCTRLSEHQEVKSDYFSEIWGTFGEYAPPARPLWIRQCPCQVVSARWLRLCSLRRRILWIPVDSENQQLLRSDVISRFGGTFACRYCANWHIDSHCYGGWPGLCSIPGFRAEFPIVPGGESTW